LEGIYIQHKTERERIVEAYLKMTKVARYRPAAPGDGMGSVNLTEEELADPVRLAEEADKYAVEFLRQEDSHFFIGVSDFSTNRALVYTVEAARALCAPNPDLALALLELAVEETEAAKEKRGG
jgi:hypothetical protein